MREGLYNTTKHTWEGGRVGFGEGRADGMGAESVCRGGGREGQRQRDHAERGESERVRGH